MRQILFAAGISLFVAILLTPVLIKLFSRQGFGQEIRSEGPASHQHKRGTPTMGGVAIIVAMWCGYWGSHAIGAIYVSGADSDDQTRGWLTGPSASGLLVLGLATGLGIVGFLDDFIKLRKQRNLGLNKTAKLVGQLIVAVLFAVLAIRFRNDFGLTPGSMQVSYVREIATVSVGTLGFIAWCYFLVSAWSNAVNLTDGLDGLAAGCMGLVLGTYVIISFWQYRATCDPVGLPAKFHNLQGCYQVRDPLDMSLLCAAGAAACVGFLWWNAAPAKIFMGDTGSLALGGMLAGLAVTTRTELLMVVIGALFVAEAASVVVQVAAFRTTGRRVFRMAPFHHHFELAGWAETTVIIRFWLLSAIASAFGLFLFYSEYFAKVD